MLLPCCRPACITRPTSLRVLLLLLLLTTVWWKGILLRLLLLWSVLPRVALCYSARCV
jgi:hypothetical protein